MRPFVVEFNRPAYTLSTFTDGRVRLSYGDGSHGNGIGWRDFVSRAEYRAWEQKDQDGRFPRL